MPEIPRSARVLVVDDEPDILRLISQYLIKEGMEVMTATGGEDALVAVAEGPAPDIVVLDVMLGPGPDGFEVCRFWKSLPETRTIPIILLTAHNDVQKRIAGSDAGADEFLAKPFDRSELVTRVHALLKTKSYQDDILRKNEKLRDVLNHWHSDKVVRRILDDTNPLKLGGDRRPVTVLFADLCGFTSYSEKVAPEEVMETLNQTFTRLTAIVEDSHGTFDKYVGDCLMAFYGAPASVGNDALNAAGAAVRMRDAFRALRSDWGDGPRSALGLAIGLNSGEVIVGNVGSERLMGYTVIGAVVNVGARLQGHARDGQILMGELTYQAIANVAVTRKHPGIELKGLAQPVPVHDLVRLYRTE